MNMIEELKKQIIDKQDLIYYMEYAGYGDKQSQKLYRNATNLINKLKAELKGRQEVTKEIIKEIDSFSEIDLFNNARRNEGWANALSNLKEQIKKIGGIR